MLGTELDAAPRVRLSKLAEMPQTGIDTVQLKKRHGKIHRFKDSKKKKEDILQHESSCASRRKGACVRGLSMWICGFGLGLGCGPGCMMVAGSRLGVGFPKYQDTEIPR
jgi:hypothetical protein